MARTHASRATNERLAAQGTTSPAQRAAVHSKVEMPAPPASDPSPCGRDQDHKATDGRGPTGPAGPQAPACRLGTAVMSEGTAHIHPATGIRKAWSVGCTQSMEHSSGLWYDGREHPSGALEHLDFEPVEGACGFDRRGGGGGGGGLYMCYYAGELYADSEAVYSDEDDEGFYEEEGDDDDDEEDDEDEEDEETGDEISDDGLYMRFCPRDSQKGGGAGNGKLITDGDGFGGGGKPRCDQYSYMSSPVDAHDLHGRLMMVQGQE